MIIKNNVTTAAAFVLPMALLAACVPASLPQDDPLIGQAISAFETGCVNTAPGFENVEEIWRSQGVTKIKENGTNLPFDRFGLVTFNGNCGIGIKGEALVALENELIALMGRRNIEILKEARNRPGFTYAGKISLRNQDMAIGVSGRTFSGFGYWSIVLLVPTVPEDDDLFEK